MILLCDLDGTLLANNMAAFQPPYLKSLGAFLSKTIPPEKMIPELLTGTRKMFENDDPQVTLESAFDRHFYPSLGFDKHELSGQILAFYQHEFPSLGSITRQLPEAIEFVTGRLSAGDRVVVATNPLFPRVATFNRLVWAGMPVDKTQFELVTTYEFMHFSKPRPTYYAEILAYLGYPEEPVLMIGNDLDDDILPAQKLGVPGFWLTASEPIQGSNGSHHPSGAYRNLAEYLANDFQPVDIYRTTSQLVYTSILKATLAALDTYSRYVDGSTRQTGESLSAMILARYHAEESLLDEFKTGDTLKLEDYPIDGNPKTALAVLTHQRLAWLKQLSSLPGDGSNSQDSGITRLLRSSTQLDRKLMMECAQWFTERPKFKNLPGETPC